MKSISIKQPFAGLIATWQKRLENPRMIEPFDVKGKLRLFEVDENLIKYL